MEMLLEALRGQSKVDERREFPNAEDKAWLRNRIFRIEIGVIEQ